MPLAALVAALLAALLVCIWTVATYQNGLARRTETVLALDALSLRRTALEKTLIDYAIWTDVEERLVAGLDIGWADRELGRRMRSTFGIDALFAIDPEGRTRYAYLADEPTSRPFAELFEADQAPLLRAARALRTSRHAASAFVRMEDRIAIVALAPIAGPEVAVAPGGATLLALVAFIDGETVREMEAAYRLSGLSVDLSGTRADEFAPIPAASGAAIGGLRWEPSRPGDILLRAALPLWFLLLLCAVFVGFTIRSQSRAANRLISDSERRVRHDPLTALPNRVLLEERLAEHCRAARSGHGAFALLYLDLDGFKAVNDTHGHAAGDRLLSELGRRLAREVREGETAARIGGDEFAFLLPGIVDRATARGRAAALIAAVECPVELRAGLMVRVGGTIGVTLAPADGFDPHALLLNADDALYRGKRAGKGRVSLHPQKAA